MKKNFLSKRFLVRLNFALSLWLSIAGSTAVVLTPSLLFPEHLEIYGPLANNLKYAIINVGIIQLLLWFIFYRRNDRRIPLLVGLFLALVAMELAFYGNVSDVPIPLSLIGICLYIGLSHILYGMGGIAATPQKVPHGD